jgi:hypothetical protein
METMMADEIEKTTNGAGGPHHTANVSAIAENAASAAMDATKTAKSTVKSTAAKVVRKARTAASDTGATKLRNAARQLPKTAARTAAASLDNNAAEWIEAAGPVLGNARHAAETMIEKQRVRAADTVKEVAGSLRHAADKFADRATGQIEAWSDVVRGRNVQNLAADVRAIAHRRPEWFIAGAAAAGFLLGRMLKASNRPGPVSDAAPAPEPVRRTRRKEE